MTGKTAICYKCVSFAGGQVNSHAPVLVGEHRRCFRAGCHVLAFVVVDKQGETVYLRRERVCKLHVVIEYKAECNALRTRRQIVFDGTAG